MSRSLVLGLDSATFDVIDPLIAAGRLPNFARLAEKGVRAEMVSTFPPRTAPAWVTLMTGMNPGKHGIFDFWFREKQGYDTVTTNLVTSSNYAGNTFFDVLSRAGQRTAALFVPMTFPTWEIEGTMIAGPPLAPDSDEGLSFPEGVHRDLSVQHDIHLFPPSIKEGINRPETVSDLLNMEEARAQVALKLWDENRYDCLMFVLESIDIVQHHLWRFFKNNGNSSFGDTIPQFYEKADQVIGQLLERLEENDLLFVVSDHGMSSHPETSFNTNAWLGQHSWLEFHRDKSWLPRLVHLGKTIAHKILPERSYVKLKKSIHSSEGAASKKLRMGHSGSSAIDWSQTFAYRVQLPDLPVDGINLNLKGREPFGSVSTAAAEALKRQVRKALLQVKDPKNDQPVLRDVHLREDVFWGPEADKMPDLILEFNDGYRAASDSLTRVLTPTPSIEIDRLGGTHSVRGIFLACGKPFAKGQEIDPFRILDFAPNLLYSMGLAVPTFMDGQLRKDCFQENFLVENEAVTAESEAVQLEGRSDYTADEIQAMEEKLRNLGYL